MNICFLSYRGNMYCGGQGVYLYYLSRALAERESFRDVPRHCKVARNVSLSTCVSSRGWWEETGWLSEKQPCRSWTKLSTSGGGLGARVCQRPQ